MKRKIGLITLNGYFNYGNRLQNMAIESCIKLKGYSIETIIIKEKDKSQIGKFRIQSIFQMSIEEKIELIKYKINKKKIDSLNNEREIKFREFTLENIVERSLYIENIKNKDEYKYFITGSDQVWNPNFIEESRFLTFVNEEKRIAYAPSFGVEKLQNSDREGYKKWINGIKYISVREEAGAKIIKELTGRDAEVLVDPTMLLNKKDWLKIARKDKNKPENKYLLTYFLGGIPNEYRKYIKKIVKENNLEIVDLANIKVPKYYVNGPSEFIDYINSAELFMTDSFHGCVFSMLMETPFVVCKRSGHTVKEDMYSRIDTFVSKFKLEDRQFENIKDKNLFKIDYTESYKILEKEREKSHRFLNNALGIKEKV